MKSTPLSIFALTALALNAEDTPKIYEADDTAALRVVGRVIETAEGPSFDWSGVYTETIIDGPSLQLRLSATGKNYFDVVVDQTYAGRFLASSPDTTITVVDSLPAGPHEIQIKKRTEGEQGRVTFHQFILPQGGTLTATVPRQRFIELIGDSMTCGYGTESGPSEHFSPETENCNLAFSTIIPRYFDADYALVAHSGRGVVRNYDDPKTCSEISMRHKMSQSLDEDTLYRWQFKAYRPDLVIINLGTNDFSTRPWPSKDEFSKGYVEIIHNLAKHYGDDVKILCVIPCMLLAPVYDYFTEIIDKCGVSDVHLLKMPSDLLDPATDNGADGHPNYSGHLKMAMTMIPYVSTITGWPITEKPLR